MQSSPERNKSLVEVQQIKWITLLLVHQLSSVNRIYQWESKPFDRTEYVAFEKAERRKKCVEAEYVAG